MTEAMMAGSETSVHEEKPAKTKRAPRGEVIIFGKWCKGCRLCVEFCPTGVLGYRVKDIPEVLHPEKCTACHWCDTHCPDLAIIVKPISS
jgi:2-oxoglutarate ferredoxin oxidoreductase subunit delta